MRVLVVEEEEHRGGMFHDLIAGLGHQPVVVRSAEAALGKLQTEHPDAIIVDIDLAGMSRLDFLQLPPIRESGLPIVTVAGAAAEHQARESRSLDVPTSVPFDRLHEVLAFLAPHAAERRAADERWPIDRRRSPRAHLAFPVRIVESSGAESEAVAIEVSPFGIKVATAAVIDAASAVRLVFTPPDGGPPAEVISLLLRVDADGPVFAFANGERKLVERLIALIERHPLL